MKSQHHRPPASLDTCDLELHSDERVLELPHLRLDLLLDDADSRGDCVKLGPDLLVEEQRELLKGDGSHRYFPTAEILRKGRNMIVL